MSGAELAIAFAVVLVGATVQGGVGFGMNLIAAPILIHVDADFVPVPLLVAGWSLAILTTHRERSEIDRPGLLAALAGRLPGSLLGALAVAALAADDLSLLFGVLLLAAVLLSVSGWRVRRTPLTLAGAGLASGFMATTVSVGGPPMAIVYQDAAGPTIRATQSAYIVVGGAISVGLLAVVGEVTGRRLATGAMLAIPVAVGFAVSGPLRAVLDRGWIRPAIYALATAASITLLLEGSF